jgi:hypothetical protein
MLFFAVMDVINLLRSVLAFNRVAMVGECWMRHHHPATQQG